MSFAQPARRAAPAEAPGTHLVSDITYIPTEEGWLYLAVVIDRFSRMILGWNSPTHARHARRRRSGTRHGHGMVAPGALFHSDRGCQYSAALTRSCLARQDCVKA